MKIDSESAIPTKLVFGSQDIENFETKSKNLVKALSISPRIAEILVCRGVETESDAREFISPSLKNSLPDPFNMKNIREAAELVVESIQGNEKITVFTDFDVDGLSSGAQLVLFLQRCGAQVGSYTPNRFSEGYGLSVSAVEKIAKTGTKLLVTVDCGISNNKEILLARKLGLKTIILDHHLPQELPKADVVVDPAQEGCPFQSYKLAAAGLVWLFLIVLRSVMRERELAIVEDIPDPKEFLDLAALGTICDMVPLFGINRLIAYRGLQALSVAKRPGLQALKKVCSVKPGKRFTSGHVGFMLGPRINAAGRVGEGKVVIELLTTESSKKASSLAKSVDRQNSQRQKYEKNGLEDSLRILDEEKLGSAIVVYGESLHLGVIGIIAQRLVEQYNRPSIVMAPADSASQDCDGLIKGSARSFAGFNIVEAFEELATYLETFGGHAAAGGFSLKSKNLEPFKNAFLELANERLSADDLRPIQRVDVEVPLSEIDYDFVTSLSCLEPFGYGNPAPVFFASGLEIESVKDLSGDHLKLLLSATGRTVAAVAWKFAGHPLLVKGNMVSVAYVPEINTWNGVSSVQLNLKEVWSAQEPS